MKATFIDSTMHSCSRPASITMVTRRQTIVCSATPAAAPTTPTSSYKATKPTLFDVPVSNNGARIRWILYKKGLEQEFDIIPPADIGGLKSEAFLQLNPQGKMPLLVLPDGLSLPESQVIESYLLDKYKGVGPDLLPQSPELRAIAALAARIHDIYIAPIQGCMYKPYEDAADRRKKIGEISFQLDVLEKTVIGGPFVCGKEISFGDGALLPTFVFFTYILPRHFGWNSVFTNRPKLAAWWDAVSADPEGARVINEMIRGLEVWESTDRWQKMGVADQVADKSLQWDCGC